MKKRQLAALLLALAMIFSLTACSGGGTGDTNTDSVSEPATTTTDSGSGTEGTVPELVSAVEDLGIAYASSVTSVQRDVINVGIPADVANFSPWSFSGQGANQALMSLYQPLLHHDNGEYASAIAKDNFVIADDGMSCDFELFDYIFDWQGNHITVDDVIFSIAKCSEARPQYAKLITEVEKTGDYTCTFHFSHALELGDFDSFVRIFIVSEKAYNESGDGMASNPVGTGHYKMTSYTSGYSMVYEKVEDYWQTDLDQLCVRDMANVDTINFYVISESAQRTMALDAGTIDICMSVGAEDLPKFDDQGGYQIAQIASNDTMTMFCNCDPVSLCNDLNLRLAISYAVSGDAILQGVYKGDGVVCHELTPNYAGGYNLAWDSEDNYYNYDAAKAKEYLSQSSYSNQELVIICNSSDDSSLAAQLVLSFLDQIGVKSKIEAYESTVFEEYVQNPSKWDIMIDTTQYNNYYVEGVFSNYDVSRYAKGGGINFAYDDQLQNILTTCMDLNTYTQENIDQLHQYLVENCYVKGLATTVDQFVVPDYMTGLGLNYRGFILPGACTYS
jgi:ABC-type transport system substrate-binding protein